MNRGRGRPRKQDAQTPAQRQAAYRERHGLVSVTVELPRDLVASLDNYLRFKDVTRSAVFERLLRSQLLRKR